MTHASGSTHIADAQPTNWVERFLPAAALPYAQLMRLDRPIGWWLLLLPCWWGQTLAQLSQGGGLPSLWHGLLFFVGAIVMRGAGCTLNDIADQKFDAQVERTKNRPLASGRLSRLQAFLFMAVLCLAGLIILLQFNAFTVWLGASSLLIVGVYPFMKRITHWPQAVLGLAFNWGALVGWASHTGGLNPAPLLLYGAGVFWTLAYDTIYAHQDKEDDIMIGVKSTALLFGERTRIWLAAFFSLAILLMAAALWLVQAHVFAFAGLGFAALHAIWQVAQFDVADGASCLKLFKANRTFGLVFLVGLLLDCLIA